MGDTIIFMSAYDITRYSKSGIYFHKKQQLNTLLKKHHLTYMLLGDKLISPKGVLSLTQSMIISSRIPHFHLNLLRKIVLLKN